MQMENQIIYRWWNDKDTIPEHEDELEEKAHARIFEMLKRGYLAGELLADLTHPKDEKLNVYYNGHWEIKRNDS